MVFQLTYFDAASDSLLGLLLPMFTESVSWSVTWLMSAAAHAVCAMCVGSFGAAFDKCFCYINGLAVSVNLA